jgi:dihydrofolate reductase
MAYFYRPQHTSHMLLSAITAVAENNVIGKDNALPWRLPADMRYFKNTTMGHAVIMGRKTYDSFGKALPGRTNIVVTTRSSLALPDAVVVHSVEEAVTKAREIEPSEAFVLGGAQIYGEMLPVTDRIYLTRIFESFEGDAFFPRLESGDWELVSEDSHEPDEKNRYAYSFQLWKRLRR